MEIRDGALKMKIEIMGHKAVYKRLEDNPANTGIVLIADDALDIQNTILDNWKNKKILFFRDITDASGYKAMTAVQATEIKDYVLSKKDSMETLIISCHAGVSRSPAIAAGLLAGSGKSDMHIWRNPQYSPNILCYKRMLRAFNKPTLLAIVKKHISEQSLKKATRRS